MKKILPLIILLFAIIGCVMLYNFKFKPSKLEKKQEELFKTVTKEEVDVTKYIVYGTHLNIEASLNRKLYEDNILSAELIFKNLEGKDIKYEIEYELSDDEKFVFKTSDYINQGIDLEKISKGNYYPLLKLTQKNLNDESKDKVEYFSLKNKTKYDNLDYYTITKNKKNNKIDIIFDKFKNTNNYMNIVVKEEKLPKDVYDIAIDPGHGGIG